MKWSPWCIKLRRFSKWKLDHLCNLFTSNCFDLHFAATYKPWLCSFHWRGRKQIEALYNVVVVIHRNIKDMTPIKIDDLHSCIINVILSYPPRSWLQRVSNSEHRDFKLRTQGAKIYTANYSVKCSINSKNSPRWQSISHRIRFLVA